MTATPTSLGPTGPEPRTFYLDTSALVKRYMAETGSAWIEAICADEDTHAIAIAHVGPVEAAAAFAVKRRGKFISLAEYDNALADLIRDAQHRYQLVGISQTIVDSAIQLRNYLRTALLAGVRPRTRQALHGMGCFEIVSYSSPETARL